MVSAKDASFSLMIGISTEEWEYIPYLGLMFFQTSSQEVFQMEPITDKPKINFLRNKHKSNIMCVGDNILYSAE